MNFRLILFLTVVIALSIWLGITLYVALTTAIAIAGFAWLEITKKFIMMGKFCADNDSVIGLLHSGFPQKETRMRQIELLWDEPFTVLVAFDFNYLGRKGVDHFGCVSSKETDSGVHQIIIETFYGNKPAMFRFIVNKPFINSRPIVNEFEVGHFVPDAVYAPHWFQKLLKL